MAILENLFTVLIKTLEAGNAIIGYVLLSLPVLAGIEWLCEKKLNSKVSDRNLRILKGFNKTFFRITNVFLLVFFSIIGIGLLSFTWSADMFFGSITKYISFAWIVLFIVFMVVKEFKVKSIGRRVLLNLAIFPGFGLIHFLAIYSV